MASNLYYDILRVQASGGATGLNDILRNKQSGHEGSGTYRMGHKMADGTMQYWTPDGYQFATGIQYSSTTYPAVNTVQDALDTVISSITGIGMSGFTGLSADYLTKGTSEGKLINSGLTDDGTTVKTLEQVQIGVTGIRDSLLALYEDNSTRDCFTGYNGTLCLRNADTTASGGDLGIEMRSYHAWVSMMIERRVTNDYFHLYDIRNNRSWFRTIAQVMEFNPGEDSLGDVKFYGCSGIVGQFDAGKNSLIVPQKLNVPNLPLATSYDSLESGDLYYCDGPGLTGVLAYQVYVK